MTLLFDLDIPSKFIDAYQAAPTEKQKINTLIQVVLEYRMEEPEKCLAIADEIIERSKVIHYDSGEGNGYNHKGACYWIMGEYEEGLEELTIALDIAQRIKDKDLEAKALNNFGRIYRDLGDLANSLKNFEESMVLNEALQNEINLSINLINISTLYYDLGDYDTALEYAEKTVSIFEKNEDIYKQVQIYHNLGNIFFKQENYTEAEKYFEKILAVAKGNILYKGMAESGLGKVYFRMGNFLAAEEYLFMSLKAAKLSNSFETEIATLFYLSKLYLAKGNYEESLKYGLQGYNLAEEYHRKQDLMSFHEVLSSIYDNLGNVKEAFEHLKKFENFKEQIFKQTTLNKMRNLQIKNQVLFAKKEKEVAEKTAELKQQFMANMSHEIRTPMNAIVGLVNLLINRSPRPDQMKYLHAIEKSANNLLVIINDILDLSKIEAGKIVLEHIPFSISQTVEGIYNTLFLKAEEKQLQFYFQVENKIPDVLMGDPTRLSQILINLIGNAIKFTEKGSVTLDVKIAKQQSDEYFLQFAVIDTGIGIAEDYVQSIFESFTQAGTDTARKFGGTGLGLTISKQLTDLMHGSIRVESTLGSGTTFFVTIPFTPASNAQIEESKENDFDIQALSGLKILLVEDNEFNVMVAEETLLELITDVQISHAANGKIAVDMINEAAFDIVLMDIQMPVMDGMEATKMIRGNADARIADTKIIALTANAFEEDIKKYFRLGMNGYITKPFKQDELLRELYIVLKNGTNNPEKSSMNEENLPVQETEKFIMPDTITDMTFLNNFSGGNAEKRDKYVSMFLKNAPKLLEDIKQGYADNNNERIKIAAHSLKPQLGYMGVTEDVSNIYLLEMSAGENAHQHKIQGLIQRLELVIEKCIEELS